MKRLIEAIFGKEADFFLVEKPNGESWWVTEEEFGTPENYETYRVIARYSFLPEIAPNLLGRHMPHINQNHRILDPKNRPKRLREDGRSMSRGEAVAIGAFFGWLVS